MAHRHLCLRPQHVLDARGGALDGVHPVVEVVYLAPPLQLPAHGVGQHRPVVLQHVGLHRLAVGGGLLDGGHVPDAGQRHIQRAGDGGGGQGEHVHLLGHLLQPLLMGDAEALLLVHYQQPQVLEAHVLLQQPVGADEQVYRAVLHPGQRLFHLGGGAEAADDLNLHRVFGKPGARRQVVLAGQHGGGHQDGGLLAVQHTLHHRPQGHLRFAVAHVAAQQPVHGAGGLHVFFNLPDGAQLVLRLVVGEVVLKLLLPGGVGGEGVARLALALGVELDEALCQVLHRLAGAGLGLFPIRAPQLGQLFGLRVVPRADIFGDGVQLGGGEVEHVRPGVGKLHVVLVHPVHRHLHHAHKPADAVVLVDDEVPGG